MIYSKLTIFLWLSLAFISCGSPSQKSTGNALSETEKTTVQAMQEHPGKRVYDQYCKACHMADGAGIRGLHPPLINNKTVNGNAGKLIEVTMKGMSGKVVIDGVVYNGIMPPHTHLTNQQIADVLTYVRQNFSNNSGPITPEDVAKLR
jgi:mono/diheme cytochrome c family protein